MFTYETCSLMRLVHSQSVRLNHVIIFMTLIMWLKVLVLLTPWNSCPWSNTIISHITYLFRYLDMLPNYIASHYFLIVIPSIQWFMVISILVSILDKNDPIGPWFHMTFSLVLSPQLNTKTRNNS